MNTNTTLSNAQNFVQATPASIRFVSAEKVEVKVGNCQPITVAATQLQKILGKAYGAVFQASWGNRVQDHEGNTVATQVFPTARRELLAIHDHEYLMAKFPEGKLTLGNFAF